MNEVSPSTDRSSENDHAGSPFPIVGFGASAGGLEAFTQLLDHLPHDTGMSFVLIQHLDPSRPSRLHDLLSKTTPLPVQEVTEGMTPQPDHVYIIPKNTNMVIETGVFKLTPRDASQLHLPIDCFFRSLALDRLPHEDRMGGEHCMDGEARTGGEVRGQAIGIVLSGTGADGTLGIQELKARGGITFAQDEASAKFLSMPQNAVSHGNVDFVMPPEQIARELARIAKHPYLATSHPRDDDDGQVSGAETGFDEPSFCKIISLLRTTTGVDFTHYRDSTIKRRILRRMVLHNQPSLTDYVRLLESDRGELETLFHEILINVTTFFRDPEVFEALERDVFPSIVTDQPPGTPIRVWTAGCSTGQEAYSIAMTLLEFLEDQPQAPQIQIFATDLSDSVALATARAGRYPKSIEAEVSPQRL